MEYPPPGRSGREATAIGRATRLRWTLRVVLALSMAVLLLDAVGADTIYLKNGRVIHTASAQVEDERVIFLQYGHPVAIPMSQVERIEENDRSGPEASTPREPTPGEPTSPAPGSAASTRSEAPPSSPAPPPVEETKEYWQDRVRAIEAESVSLDLELKQLRRVERAFLFSHRSTADTRRQIEAVQERIEANKRALPELRREARRNGIPPGWLRLPSGG